MADPYSLEGRKPFAPRYRYRRHRRPVTKEFIVKYAEEPCPYCKLPNKEHEQENCVNETMTVLACAREEV